MGLTCTGDHHRVSKGPLSEGLRRLSGGRWGTGGDGVIVKIGTMETGLPMWIRMPWGVSGLECRVVSYGVLWCRVSPLVKEEDHSGTGGRGVVRVGVRV